MRLVFLFLVLFSSNVYAEDFNYFRLAANTTLVLDWLQTREIAREDQFIEEVNGILGEYPSQNDVNKYFITSILLTNIVGEILPAPYGDYFYLTVAVVEANMVARNYTLGVRIAVEWLS